jgi:hypothetical protein
VKKYFIITISSLFFFSQAKSMELVRDVGKNKVGPAALIMGAGVAMGAFSGGLAGKICNVIDCKRSIKQGAFGGLLASTGVVLGSFSFGLEYSYKDCAILGGLATIPYCFWSGYRIWKEKKDYERILQTINLNFSTEDATRLKYRLCEKHNVMGIILHVNGFAVLLLPFSMLFMRIIQTCPSSN